MRPSIQATIFPKVLSETNVTGRLPAYCSIRFPYADAREMHIEGGRMLIQRYSNYLFFIEIYELHVEKEIKTAYVVNESSFYLFFMFDGDISASAPDGSDIAKANKSIWYANYKEKGSTFINNISPGTHRFCYISPRLEWLERKSSEFSAIEKSIKTFRDNEVEYGYMPRCQIDNKALRLILSLFNLKKTRGEDVEVHVLNQVVQLLRLYNDMIVSGAFVRSDAQKERIRIVQQYIEENSRDLKIGDIQQIADRFFFARRTLTRIFKSETGLTVQEYIEKCKLESALKLLRETKLSIGEVSRLAGYPDQNYFSRVMQKQFSTSPKNIRQFLNLNGASFSTIWP